MASRATRYLAPAFRSGFRSSQTAFRTSGRRGMASTTSPSTQSNRFRVGFRSDCKEKKHDHAAPKATKEPAPEPVAAEPTPEPVLEEKPAEATPEPSATESGVSDDDGVVISKEELEESIDKAVDADVPNEAKAAETTEATSSEPAPAPSESEAVKDGHVAAPPKEESTESTPPRAAEDVPTEKKGAESQ